MPERKDELQSSTQKWMAAGAILMGLFFLAFPVYRVFEPSQRADARVAQEGYLADQGAEIFGSDCASCHGVDGRGGLGPALGAKEFLDSATDEQIAQLISLGVPGTEMVAYSIDFGGPMTSEEIQAVTTYIRSLEESAASNPNWRTPLADEGLTGSDLFILACSRCHGEDRMGIQGVAPNISADSTTMEESDDWIAARIHDGFKSMPRWGGVLTDQQIQMLVNFLRGRPDDYTPTTTTTVPTGTTVPGETTTTTIDTGDAEVLALGERIFQEIAGGHGCQECHGTDAGGTANGPNIRGVSKSSISNALGGAVPDMDNINLTPDELDAVYRYLQSLLGT